MNNIKKNTTKKNKKVKFNSLSSQSIFVEKQEKKSMAPVILTLFLLAVAGGGGWFLFTKYGEYQKRQELELKAKLEEQKRLQAKAAEEKARREAEQEIRRQAKLQQAYDNALKYAEQNSKNPEIVKAYLLKMKKFFAGTEFEAKIDLEIRNLRMARKKAIAGLMKRLEEKAERFSKEKKYNKAARIFASYTGKYEEETAPERSRKASYYMTLRNEYKKSAAEFNKYMEEIAEALICHDYPKALGLLEKAKSSPCAESKKECLEKTAGFLKKVKDIDKYIKEALLKSKGKVISLKTENGKKIKGKILSVSNSSFYLKTKFGKAIIKKKIKFDDLSLNEKMRLIGEDEQFSKLFAGLSLAQKGRASDACERYFAKVDNNPLFSAIFNKLQNPSKINKRFERAAKEDPAKAEPAGKSESNLNPDRLQLKAIVRRPKKASGRDYDDRKQEIKCRVSLTNKNHDDAQNYNVDLYIIGKSAVYKNEYRVLKVFSEQLNLPSGRNIDTKENSFVLNYDNNARVRYGFIYEGYVVAVKDDSDKIFKTKCSDSKLRKITDKIIKFQEDTSFDKAGKIMESSTPVYD